MAPRKLNQPTLIEVEDKQFEVLESSNVFEKHPLTKFLRERVVGQEGGIRAIVTMYARWELGLIDPRRPLGTVLFLGPTGVGKTQLVESFAEYLFGKDEMPLRVDCGEFQAAHDIEKLKGSPPGYLGHRETQPYFSVQSVEQRRDKKSRFVNVLLIDEVEKANDSLFKLLLGILDQARMTTGTNTLVKFNRVFILLTANLGAEEMQAKLGRTGVAGFHIAQDENAPPPLLHDIAVAAARKKFAPEFFNRLDHLETFIPLSIESMRAILSLEMLALQSRLLSAGHPISLAYSPEVYDRLLQEGFDQRYGARYLKRAFERLIVTPLQELLAGDKTTLGNKLTLRVHNNALKFTREKAAGATSGATL